MLISDAVGYCLQRKLLRPFSNCKGLRNNEGHFTNEGARGGIVVKALRYKPAGRGFDSRLCHWNISVTYSFRSLYDPGVDSASNKSEYQVYFLGEKAAGA